MCRFIGGSQNSFQVNAVLRFGINAFFNHHVTDLIAGSNRIAGRALQLDVKSI